MVVDELYKKAILEGTGIPIAKVEFLRLEDESIRQGLTLVEEILSMSVSINRSNGVRRAISFEIENIDGRFNPSQDGRFWVNSKFKVSMGVRIPIVNGSGNVHYEDRIFSQGIFVNRSPVASSGGRSTLKIDGIDKYALIDGQLSGTLQSTYFINSAVDVLTAINAILDVKLDAFETNPRDPAPRVMPPLNVAIEDTFYPIIEGTGKTLSDVINHMQKTTSRNTYYDDIGMYRFVDDVPDLEKPSAWHFDTVDDGTSEWEGRAYLNGVRVFELEKVKNKVVIFGSNVNGVTVRGEAVNSDPRSSVCVQKIGVKMLAPITVSSIREVDQAIAYAKYLLKRFTALQNSVTLKCIPLWHINEDDVVEISDKNLGFKNHRFVVLGISRTSQGMSLKLIDVDEFITL